MPPVTVILIAFAVAFIADLIGNIVAFGSRIGNAIASAIVFAVIFGAAAYFTGQIDLNPDSGEVFTGELKLLGFAALLFFVVGLVGNIVAFGNRFVNAFVTALIFAALFVAAHYGLTEFAGANFLRG